MSIVAETDTLTEVENETALPTPALVIDQAKVEANLSVMADYCQTHGLGLRPHTKTHKSIAMARRQIDHGAIGLTVAKAGEAELMAEASRDLLVAYPAVDTVRLTRLCRLAASGTNIRLAADTTAAVDAMSAAADKAHVCFGVLADLDIGHHRTGVDGIEALVALAKHIHDAPGLRFDGIMFYPGNVMGPGVEHSEAIVALDDRLSKAIDALSQAGLEPTIVSGGSTPTRLESHQIEKLTEVRPGTYIYQDWNGVSSGWCAIDDVAATVLCTVVSDAVPGKVILDAGSKSLTSDRLVSDPETGGYGRALVRPEARMTRLSEEHGELDVSDWDDRPHVGDRLHIVPNHICPAVNLFDRYWLRRPDGSLIAQPVDARGRLS